MQTEPRRSKRIALLKSRKEEAEKAALLKPKEILIKKRIVKRKTKTAKILAEKKEKKPEKIVDSKSTTVSECEMKDQAETAPTSPLKTLPADAKVLELGLLCDCTSSMYSWIDKAKTTLKEIISNIVKACCGNLRVRVCFIGYRDHGDSPRFSIKDFTEDIDSVKSFIQGVSASGGGDAPEDVVGGLKKCLD
jgi:hypothetical protein